MLLGESDSSRSASSTTGTLQYKALNPISNTWPTGARSSTSSTRFIIDWLDERQIQAPLGALNPPLYLRRRPFKVISKRGLTARTRNRYLVCMNVRVGMVSCSGVSFEVRFWPMRRVHTQRVPVRIQPECNWHPQAAISRCGMHQTAASCHTQEVDCCSAPNGCPC